jgi:hypothetical protein
MFFELMCAVVQATSQPTLAAIRIFERSDFYLKIIYEVDASSLR